MDAGTSAVLAGGITALAGLGGNYFVYRQTKRQTVSEAQLQLREPRKRTYNDFLTVCREARDTLGNLVDEDTREADPSRIADVIEQHRCAMQRALGAVDLEGPKEVSDAARAARLAFTKLLADAFITRAAGDVHDDGRPVGFSGDFTGGIREALERYVETAQKALRTFAD
ncbi:hypothetical protein H181DRAFT_00462 [Streptomyces sp. WMMB 714]|uniref:hypothetical protein n=1 Tax=Streptomyces sp. WMMB 714 TaxID=1286822 RepID=UPI00082376DC|nr:hypothetical protein [Streptomyces sp. WMMB 714]SCK09400.1 hypothetical protein H181DRAFT_00462 [Streptomyces sp. WMMB 714]